MSLITFNFTVILFFHLVLKCHSYFYTISPRPNEESIALNSIVDVTNDLSFKLLQQHSIGNNNNFAFSPTALTSVLLALYEGSEGQSASEIAQALHLSWNRDRIRVGSRNIQENLKPYSYNKDDPLKGLSFNRGNYTISSEYKSILKFYGFELSFMMLLLPDTTNLSTKSSSSDETQSSTNTPEINEVTTSISSTNTIQMDLPHSTQENMPMTTSETTKLISTENTLKTETTYPDIKTDDQTTVTENELETTISVEEQARKKRNYIPFFNFNYYIFNPHAYNPYTPPIYVTPVQNNLNTLLNGNDIHHLFYINNNNIVHTAYKSFNSLAKFCYFTNIRSAAIEFDLNSKDSSLLIFVPDFDVDIQHFVALLNKIWSLRQIRQNLKKRFVKATIPDIKLMGTIFLTNDLQNMGIKHVFEPFQANLNAITNESDIYVKHIQQSINIDIQTQAVHNTGFNSQRNQIEVFVNRPFIFIIMDKHLGIATMAGRVINPLSSRIH